MIVVETAKGTFEFETYPNEAPKTVAHIVELVKRGFYNGQRFHARFPGFVVQFGDPQIARPVARGRLGTRAGGVERHADRRVGDCDRSGCTRSGAVAMAHLGNPAQADSQIYVTLATRPDLNGKYTVFGQVIAGDDVPARLERGDVITEDVREGVTVRRPSRRPPAPGSVRRNSGGYSPSIGSPSCCLSITALATDFAEK